MQLALFGMFSRPRDPFPFSVQFPIARSIFCRTTIKDRERHPRPCPLVDQVVLVISSSPLRPSGALSHSIMMVDHLPPSLGPPIPLAREVPPAKQSSHTDELDVVGECKDAMIAHLKCLKTNAYDNGKCRLEARRYLQCRMDKSVHRRLSKAS